MSILAQAQTGPQSGRPRPSDINGVFEALSRRLEGAAMAATPAQIAAASHGDTIALAKPIETLPQLNEIQCKRFYGASKWILEKVNDCLRVEGHVEQLEKAVSLKSEVQSAWRELAKARAVCRSAIERDDATVVGTDSGISGSDIHASGLSGSGSHDSRIENRRIAECKLDLMLDNLKAHHEKILQPTLFSSIINFCSGQLIKITKNTPLLLKMVARPVEIKDDIPSFDEFKSIAMQLKSRFGDQYSQVKECGHGRIVLTRRGGDTLEFMYKRPGKMWVIHNGKWVGDSWTAPAQSIVKSFFDGSKEPYRKIEYSGDMKIPTRLPKQGN